MKKIIMVRHATAAAAGPDVEDFTRSLRKKGHKEAKAMIAWYLDNAPEKPDLMLSSPANRAIETARLFAKGLGYKAKKIARDKNLYGTEGNEEFLAIIKSLDDDCHSVMVFGHDPEFSEFARYMVRGFEQDLPKCSVLAFGLNRKMWTTIQPGDGKLEYFQSPGGLRLLRKRITEMREDLASRIEQSIWNVLVEIGVDKAEDKNVRRASARIAKAFVTRAPLEKVEAEADARSEENSK